MHHYGNMSAMNTYITSLTDRAAPARATSPSKSHQSSSFADSLKEYSDKVAPNTKQTVPSGSVILVGEISRARQTVSELLMKNRELKNSTWNILSAAQNQDKDYTKLPLGTKIYYNSADGSLSWSGASPSSSSVATPLPSAPSHVIQPVVIMHDSPESLPASGKQLGVINDTTPTVSHLLKAHPELGKDAWNILSAPANKGKDFKSLPVGTPVQIDTLTHEIRWQSSQDGVETAAVRTEDASTLPLVKTETEPAPPAGEMQPVLLGRIDQNSPTVSHLLQQHPELDEPIWSVLGNSLNRGKPFSEIPVGTEIYLQPGSQEIVWGAPDRSSQTPTSKAVEPQASPEVVSSDKKRSAPSSRATDLTEAVKPFMGKPYKDINCYELLVKGLERMDIQYSGKNGLFTKLTRMAREKGLPANAFLTGEGIVQAAGSLVFSRSFPKNSNWRREAEQVYKEMEPLLDKGQILSFSTKYRGHTGIISQQEKQWTFINSGRLDNSLTANSPSSGVGEEVLQREIRNWFKLANASGESLTVTLGALGQEKVVTAFNMSGSVTNPKRI